MEATQAITRSRSARKRKVPDYLVKETIDGIPYYYRGYRSVLSKKKTFEEIMGWSGLQGFIVQYFIYHVLNRLNPKAYLIFPGGTGNHLGYRNNLSLDISVFDRKTLTPERITAKYVDVPAFCVIEVDIQAEWDDANMTEVEFIGLKTQKLFDFGTQKLIWVLSRSKKIIVAEPGKNWEIIDWNKEIELIDGVTFNVGKYLADEGINPDI